MALHEVEELEEVPEVMGSDERCVMGRQGKPSWPVIRSPESEGELGRGVPKVGIRNPPTGECQKKHQNREDPDLR
jgi:hypothetical protein